MAFTPTTNLSLPLIDTGTESGTWGELVDNGLTSYLDIAIAGGLALTITTADVTLANTAGTSSVTNIGSTTAQYAILNISGAKTAARSLIVPSSSRRYYITNAGTGGYLLTVKGAATTGVTLVDGETAIIVWNGTDYVKVAPGITTAGAVYAITSINAPTAASPATLAITGGASSTAGGSGSIVNITAGAGAATATAAIGGAVNITAGAGGSSVTGTGGNAYLIAGAGSGSGTGTGGNVYLQSGAGAGSGSTSGNVYLYVASGTTNGSVRFQFSSTERARVLDTGAWSFGSGGTNYGTSGQVLTSAGNAPPTWSTPAAAVTGGKTLFTSSGSGQTFTVPTGVTAVKVTVIGGGADGGNSTVSGCNYGSGGGGGAGGAAIKWLTGLVPGGTLTVAVGAAAGASSVASGTSNTITTVSATGGSVGNPGVVSATSPGGAGGLGTNGDLNMGGGGGGIGGFGSGSATSGGSGGASILGGGGSANSAGRAYGGGGGGNLGAGAVGLVMFEY